MKNKLLAQSFIAFVILIGSCQNQEQHKANKVFISGKVLNYESYTDVNSFRIYLQDFFEFQNIITVEINDTGAFQTSVPCYFKMDLTIRFDKAFAKLICAPGDSIFLTIDANILNDSKQHLGNDGDFMKVVGGSRVDDNKLVNDFLKRIAIIAPYSERRNALKQKEPMEYNTFWNELYNKKSDVLDSILETKSTDLFKIWSKDLLKYEKLNNLIRYSWLRSITDKISEDSLDIPDEYYKRIFAEDINDSEVLSMYHYYFLHSYFSYLRKQAKRKGINVAEYINENATGFPKDFALAKYYYNLTKKSDTVVNINYDLIENKIIKDLLAGQLNEQQKKKAELLERKGHSVFIDSLFRKYKGKVVYVDFWATWCKPCLAEMPNSKLLQDRFKDKNVEFLYLCCQSEKDNWQRTINKKNLTGTHILLTDNQFAEFSNLFNIGSVPHYVLVNKEGGFINNAPSPGDKNIVKKINQLLGEK